jgi:PD-(D/E)XK nuclease superfamily
VLRWFLDTNGDHGCGDALLTYVLGRVGSKLDDRFPAKPSTRCTVVVEECPDGDRASRVNVQADDPGFFLVIEVKIDAPEQPRQLERYCDIASARAGPPILGRLSS